jgi:hypothetical protein
VAGLAGRALRHLEVSGVAEVDGQDRFEILRAQLADDQPLRLEGQPYAALSSQ